MAVGCDLEATLVATQQLGTAPRVASIVDAGGGSVCASTKSQYKSAKTKYWTQFCKESLWDATEKFKLVDDQGRVNDGTIRQFFIWLDNFLGMTFHPMKNCKQWPQEEAAGASAAQAARAPKRRRRADGAAPGQHIQSDQLTSMGEVWREYTVGLNGGPALRDLERNTQRRKSEGLSETEAVAALQAMLDAIPKRGKSTKPDFAALRTILSQEAKAPKARCLSMFIILSHLVVLTDDR
ncbi:hypothetical protein M885DRAFT_623727 [Pelagophyceae sp. CCMP2097]|nr:hypothetical protein M885DRAFT_623727 [Pelagophyceae sp. CCMP2097]